MTATVAGTKSAVEVVPNQRPSSSISVMRRVSVGPKSGDQGGIWLRGRAGIKVNAKASAMPQARRREDSPNQTAAPAPANTASAAAVGPNSRQGNCRNRSRGAVCHTQVEMGSMRKSSTAAAAAKKAACRRCQPGCRRKAMIVAAASSQGPKPRLNRKSGSVAPQSRRREGANRASQERKWLRKSKWLPGPMRVWRLTASCSRATGSQKKAAMPTPRDKAAGSRQRVGRGAARHHHNTQASRRANRIMAMRLCARMMAAVSRVAASQLAAVGCRRTRSRHQRARGNKPKLKDSARSPRAWGSTYCK